MSNEKYKLVLGLEIHLQLKTTSKMFCGCDNDKWGSEPNTHTCPVCLGLPGALPVPNAEAIRMTQLFGLALNCTLREHSKFDRKHYFYPDLPKGYQISQYKEPLCEGGYLELSTGMQAELERIHLEEDTAKSFHKGNKTLIDFNKSGTPLMEIVTKPVFSTPEEAAEFGRKIRDIARFLGVSDADMEKGHMRIEPNISMRTQEMEEKGELPNYKVEIKNINSFKFMERAVKAEMKRQTAVLGVGEELKQENRGFNEKTGKTVPQRSKEEAHDYRYFPEPDIPPMVFEETYISELQKELPELPDDIVARLVKDYRVSAALANVLVSVMGMEYVAKFNELVEAGVDGKTVVTYLVNKKEYQNLSVDEFKAKLEAESRKIDNTSELEAMVNSVIEANPKAVSDYKAGKEASMQFLLGMVMRKTKGKADPKVTLDLLRQKLS